MNRNETICPECEHRLNVGAHPFLGQKIRCPRCETGLAVINLRPLELDLPMPTSRSVRQEKKKSTVEVPCSECDHIIKLSAHARPGQQVTCPECQALLQVVSSGPLELDLAMGMPLPPKYRNR